MKTYHSWEELIEAYEHDMLRLEEDKTDCFAIYDHIREHINTCLAQKSYDSLSELLPYLNPSKPYPKFHHNGATMKIYFLLNALNAELKYNTCIFMSSASDYEQLLSQYALTVFAMRRLELAFSTQAMEEAKTYLTSIPFSVYTARVIAEYEYFSNYGRLYWNLYSCMKEIWSTADQIQWLTCLLAKASSSKVLLELSSLYIELQCYDKAYHYLTLIPSPTPETSALIHSLKELFHYE